VVVFTYCGDGFRVRSDIRLKSRSRALALCRVMKAFEASVERLDGDRKFEYKRMPALKVAKGS